MTVPTDIGSRRGGQHPLPHGVAVRAATGETRSGDRAVVVDSEHGTVIAAIDGLGHGPDAADAADAAAAVLEDPGVWEVGDLLRRCHERLRRTRGAAITLARLDPERTAIEWTGVGNVDACLLRADTSRRERLVTTRGVVGMRVPRVRTATLAISAGDLLLLHTDGVDRDVTDDLGAAERRGGVREDLPALAENLLVRHGAGKDDALVVVARLTGGAR